MCMFLLFFMYIHIHVFHLLPNVCFQSFKRTFHAPFSCLRSLLLSESGFPSTTGKCTLHATAGFRSRFRLRRLMWNTAVCLVAVGLAESVDDDVNRHCCYT